MATPSSILAWRIPWTEEPGRLRPLGIAKNRTRLKRLSTHKWCNSSHSGSSQATDPQPRWEQLCVDARWELMRTTPTIPQPPLSSPSPASLVPHQPFADLCTYQACSCPGAFGLFVVSSAWDTPPSSCGVAARSRFPSLSSDVTSSRKPALSAWALLPPLSHLHTPTVYDFLLF